MVHEYYKKRLFIAAVNNKDEILHPVERWEAHKNGMLHRGFTVVLEYRGQYLLQHRKNPVFDDTWDITFSSHQIYRDDILQEDSITINDSLRREWNIAPPDIQSKPQLLGKIYYKAKDTKSEFTEHEIDYVYKVLLRRLPTPNLDFAYGYECIDKKDVSFKVKDKYVLSPWVKKILQEIF